MYEQAVIGAHFWKRVNEKIADELSTFNRSMMLIHNSAEFPEMVHFMNLLPSHIRRIMYVSLTKSFGSIHSYFPRINSSIYLIDCVTLAYSQPEPKTDCSFVVMPENLKGMLKVINDNAIKQNPDIIIIDSLSQFLDFSEEMMDLVSLQDFTRRLRELTYTHNCKSILLYDDYKKKDLVMLTDTNIDLILRLELLRSALDWM